MITTECTACRRYDIENGCTSEDSCRTKDAFINAIEYAIDCNLKIPQQDYREYLKITGSI